MVDEVWREMAERVRNWGRWGDDDQLGTLNFITPDVITAAASLIRRGRPFSLSAPLNSDGPQSAGGLRRNPMHVMTLDGGDELFHEYTQGWGGAKETVIADRYRSGPMRYNDDLLIMPPQASTQWDALSHVYYEGTLYNGFPATSVSSLGASKNAIDAPAQAGQVVTRGVLLDVARHRGVAVLPPHAVITAEELDDVVRAQSVTIRSGDVVLLRTGWWSAFTGGMPGGEWLQGTPGVSWRTATWFWENEVAAVAADNMTVEVMPPEDDVFLLFHMLAIRDMGMMLGEMWNLEELSRDCHEDGVYEFMLAAPALEITGGVGSPVNPVAIK